MHKTIISHAAANIVVKAVSACYIPHYHTHGSMVNTSEKSCLHCFISLILIKLLVIFADSYIRGMQYLSAVISACVKIHVQFAHPANFVEICSSSILVQPAKGWGVRSSTPIPAGVPVCRYAGILWKIETKWMMKEQIIIQWTFIVYVLFWRYVR